jgi:hypothetical protein
VIYAPAHGNQLAMDRGATVTHAADIAQALAVLRAGRGARASGHPLFVWRSPKT